MGTKFGTVLGLAVVALTTVAWKGLDGPVTLSPASQLWVEGKSTVKDWKCVAETLQATIEGPGAEPTASILAGEKAISTVELSILVEKLNCNNNGTMNEHMKKALKAKENPAIQFHLVSYELAPAEGGKKGVLTGSLRIGGAEKQVVLSVDIVAAPEGGLRVRGSQVLSMTDFGLKPPSLMLGTMKVKDQVTVGFDLLLESKS